MTYSGRMLPDLMDAATGKRAVYTKEPRMPVMMYVSPELHDRIALTAQECGTSMAGLCRLALISYLDGLDAEAGQ